MSFYIPNLEDLVPEEHIYRRILKLISFSELCRPLEKLYSDRGRAGYPVTSGFKCLLVQFMNDLSDRQMEMHLKDSLSAKLFCGFELCSPTPDHTYFTKFRERIGTHRLGKLFARVNKSLKGSVLCTTR
ncbi:MAG: transposase [bacterium]|nr:transposase [bacterium]